MLSMTYLAVVGYKRIHFTWLEKNERKIIVPIILALGVFASLLG